MITLKQLRTLLAYDSETGVFTWKVDVARNVKAGDVAGSSYRGNYIRIRIDGKAYFAHRLAWLYETGKWPTHLIDHIDRNRTNNRIANLREVTAATNQHNRPAAKPRLSSSGKWLIGIKVAGKYRHLGSFQSEQEANAAYIKAKQTYHV